MSAESDTTYGRIAQIYVQISIEAQENKSIIFFNMNTVSVYMFAYYA